MLKINASWRLLLLTTVYVIGCFIPVCGNSQEPIRALLVLGGCCHDYKTQQTLLTEGISKRANVQWKIAYDSDNGTKHVNPVYENEDWANGFDVIVHDECCADVKDSKTIDRVLAPHRKGIPAMILHCGMHSYRGDGYPDSTPWFDLTGVASTGHGPQSPIQITFTDRDNVITKGIEDWLTIKEELYNNSAGKLHDTAHALATGQQTFKDRNGDEVTATAVVVWTNLYQEKTRVFATSLGHNNETVADERYLDLVTRGLLWAVNKLDKEHLVPSQQTLIKD